MDIEIELRELDLENVRVKVSVKCSKCESDGLMTQANAHDVVSYRRESLVCHNEVQRRTRNMVNKGCIEQGKGGLDQCKIVHQKRFQWCLERGKVQASICLIEATEESKQKAGSTSAHSSDCVRA